ncbi:MAG: DUF58 domain-containing protein [Planctomycetota bacterium]|jgi:uncharacterized protein (DUF58 family)
MTTAPYLYFEPGDAAGLQNLSLLARQVVEGFITGLHRSRHRGFSVEFAEHREYSPGDDLRHLDWVAWGRTDRYVVKQYEQQTNLRAHILLDVSRSMDYRHNGSATKFTYACFLTACLSYLMTRQQDMVGVTAFADDTHFHAPPGSTPAHLDHIFRHLEQLKPTGQTALAATCHQLARTIAKRGLIIVISDLYDDPGEVVQALQHFVYKKHQVIVFHVMDPAELTFPFTGMTSFVDMETNRRIQADPRYVREAYRRAMGEFLATWRRECSDRRIEYELAQTDTPYHRMLLSYLNRRKAFRR